MRRTPLPGWKAFVAALGLLAGGCSADAGEAGQAVEPKVDTAVSALVGRQQIDVRLPSGLAPTTAIVGTTAGLQVGLRAEIKTPAGSPVPPTAVLANTGDEPVRIDNTVNAANVTSVGPVTLGAGARVSGAVRSAGTVTLTSGASVGGGVQQNATVPVQGQSWEINVPPVNTDAIVGAGDRTLTPGSYGTASVAANGHLRLGAGTYYFQSLSLASGANLDLTTSSGPVVIYVVTFFEQLGRTNVTGGKENLLFAYLGTNRIVMPMGLSGTLVAPRTDVALVGLNEGAVFARHVNVTGGAELKHRPFAGWSSLSNLGADGCRRSAALLAIGRNGYSTGFPVDPFRDDATDRWFVHLGDRALTAPGGKGWDEDISTSAIALGDLDGDGKDEVVVGRSPFENARIQIHDDRDTNFRLLHEEGTGWGSQFGVTAIAVGNFDGDEWLEIAVGRGPGGDQQLFIYDDRFSRFALIRPISLGGRGVTDLEFGDIDGDGKQELLVARTGGNTKTGRVVVIQDATQDYAVSEFAGDWGADRDATAVAVGDMDGYGLPEIAVGRGAGDNHRVQVWRYSPNGFQMASQFHEGWGTERFPTAIDFGDVDGDGDEELVVGRGGGCSSCNDDPRVFVYQAGPTQTSVPVTIKTLGEGWGEDRGTRALAVADFDGDGRAEIAVGRSTGDNDRVIVYDDALRDFRSTHQFGRGWGNDRSVHALAASTERLCVSHAGRAKSIPDTVAAANAQLGVRRDEAAQALLKPILGRMKNARGPDDIFGVWGDEDNGNPGDGLRAILAGFTAIQHGLPPAGSPSSSWTSAQRTAVALRDGKFVDSANQWLRNTSLAWNVGTKGDFDFELMTMLGVLYRFSNVTFLDPRTNQQMPFLTSEAILGLLLHDKPCPSSVEDLAPRMDGSTRRCAFPLAGNGDIRNLWYLLVIPETENHVLMINTWSYLLNQWLRQNPRGQDVIKDFATTHGSSLTSTNSSLERGLLGMTARVLQNDLWETNARAYQAYTVRALMLLASYAEPGPVRDGAANALDYLATKYAFQSHAGRRMTPMRRNWEYKDRVGITENDYVPAMFAALTGATLRDTTPSCVGLHCMYSEGQNAGFALEAALTSYRVPALIHDFMLRPDNRQEGFGAWARMQARYSEHHYRLVQVPPYPGLLDLDIDVFPGEPAAEFYFITKSFMNAAGGRHEAYASFETDDAIDTFTDFLEYLDITQGDPLEAQKRGTDFVTKPTMLIAGGDLGYWRGAGDAEADVLLTRGSFREFWKSNNTGVYKNVALGYDSERAGSPFIIPAHWQIAAQNSIGSARFSVVKLSSTVRSFPAKDQLVVLVDLPGQAGAQSLGLWEVVPKALFATEQELLNQVISSNTRHGYAPGSVLAYTTVVSKETLTINRDYPASAMPFSAIDGSASLVGSHHVRDLSAEETRRMPLMQVRQVNASYQFTGETYASASGDGVLRVRNPCLGQELVLNSSVFDSPTRTPGIIEGKVNSACMAARSGL